jgi:hypothetical protein
MQNVEEVTTGGPEGPMPLLEGLGMFVAALQSGDATTRTAALKLFRSGLLPENQDRMVDMVAADLHSLDRAKRDAAVEALISIGKPALTVVGMRAALGKESAVRVRSVEIIGALCVAHRLPPGFALARALGDRAQAVRRAAEEAWRAVGEAAAGPGRTPAASGCPPPGGGGKIVRPPRDKRPE